MDNCGALMRTGLFTTCAYNLAKPVRQRVIIKRLKPMPWSPEGWGGFFRAVTPFANGGLIF